MLSLMENEKISMIVTEYGGHVGFMEQGFYPKFWLERFFDQYSLYIRQVISDEVS